MFEMDELIRKFSKKLNLTNKETKSILMNALSHDNYQEEVLNVLGYQNLDDSIFMFQNREEILKIEAEGVKDEVLREGEVINRRTYNEHVIPLLSSVKIHKSQLVNTVEVGEDKKYFSYEYFNPIQSQVFNTAYKTDRNFLVSAPTGAGKTDVALLTITRALKNKNSKVIYIVPMKALATEITRKFRDRLESYRVSEYTGDTDIKRKDVDASDVLVCTPEKFDVVTRKLDNVLGHSLSLMIVDEIHMLQDERGAVVESIIARVFRYMELSQKSIRIVGLSATLPNYEDVGKFIRAEDVYHFGSRYRPVPL
jgi:replicative superfamily II helicase